MRAFVQGFDVAEPAWALVLGFTVGPIVGGFVAAILFGIAPQALAGNVVAWGTLPQVVLGGATVGLFVALPVVPICLVPWGGMPATLRRVLIVSIAVPLVESFLLLGSLTFSHEMVGLIVPLLVASTVAAAVTWFLAQRLRLIVPVVVN